MENTEVATQYTPMAEGRRVKIYIVKAAKKMGVACFCTKAMPGFLEPAALGAVRPTCICKNWRSPAMSAKTKDCSLKLINPRNIGLIIPGFSTKGYRFRSCDSCSPFENTWKMASRM